MLITRTSSDFEAFMREEAAALPDYRIAEPTLVSIPFPESKSLQPFASVGLAFAMESDADALKRHTVCILFSAINDAPGFFFLCGDTYLTGKNAGGRMEAMKRVDRALSHAGVEPNGRLHDLMIHSYSRYPNESGCGFWKKLKKDPNSAGCKHVKGLFAHLVGEGSLSSVLESIETEYSQCLAEPQAAAQGGDADSLLKTLRDLLSPTRKFTFPILIEGEKGGGKTTAARDLGLGDFEHFEEVQGAAGIEGYDFLGGTVPLGDGQFVWVDGPVTRAFRLAAAGKRVLLYIDEVYRVPRRERDLFLSALSPHRGFYRLRVGRPINITGGVAEMELLEAPIANLCIVGSTNSGSDYDGEGGDPAARERWHSIMHTPSAEMVRQILAKAAAEHGMPPSVVEPLVRFRSLCQKVKTDRACQSVPSSRLLIRAMALAGSPGKIREGMEALVPGLVGRTPDGQPIPEQIAVLRKAVAKAFAA